MSNKDKQTTKKDNDFRIEDDVMELLLCEHAFHFNKGTKGGNHHII